MVLRNAAGDFSIPPEMIWYRCNEGHFTACKTRSMRNFYCKDCDKILLKQSSEKYSDTKVGKRRPKRVVTPITQKNGQTLWLTLYTESSRQNYHQYQKVER